MKKHKHDFVEGLKGQYAIHKCPVEECNKIIIKGKETPNGAFGKPKWTRLK